MKIIFISGIVSMTMKMLVLINKNFRKFIKSLYKFKYDRPQLDFIQVLKF